MKFIVYVTPAQVRDNANVKKNNEYGKSIKFRL